MPAAADAMAALSAHRRCSHRAALLWPGPTCWAGVGFPYGRAFRQSPTQGSAPGRALGRKLSGQVNGIGGAYAEGALRLLLIAHSLLVVKQCLVCWLASLANLAVPHACPPPRTQTCTLSSENTCSAISTVFQTAAAAPIVATNQTINVLVMLVSLKGSCTRAKGANATAVEAAFKAPGGYIDWMNTCSYGNFMMSREKLTILETPIECGTTIITNCDVCEYGMHTTLPG